MKPFVQLMSTNGDGTGDTEIIGTYASAAETFSITAAAAVDEFTVVERIIIYVRDTGSFDTGTYGNAITLTKGLELAVKTSDGTTTIDLTPFPVKTSGDWAALCHDVTRNGWGAGDEFLTARWTFTKFSDGVGIVLNDGESLVLTANDDFDDLVSHRVTCQGYRTSGNY